MGKQRNGKYTWSLNLDLVKVIGDDIPYVCDGPLHVRLVFKPPVTDTEFDMLASGDLVYRQIYCFLS
jgi:hypothetical protein